MRGRNALRLHTMVKRFVLFGGVRHFVDNVDDVVGVTDARVERFPRRIVARLVGGTIIIAHILLPSEVTVEGAPASCVHAVLAMLPCCEVPVVLMSSSSALTKP